MKVFLFIASFFFSFLLVQAQELPPVRNFSPATYGAENQNWKIAQSEDRNIFFANNQGLLEYNGEHWYLYPTPNESIMRSVEWHEDRVYTGSYMDFGYWERQNDGTLAYTSIVDSLNVPILEDEQFWDIISSESIVLIQSLGRIYAYNPENKTVQIVVEKQGLTKIFKVGNGIYFHVNGQGLYQIVSGEPQLIIKQDLIDGNVIGMRDSDRGIKLVTAANSLYVFENDSLELISTNQFSRPVTVYSAVAIEGEGFALGTISNGLLVMDGTGVVDYQINQSNGLSNNTVLSVFVDVDDNLWAGLDNGIDYINLTSRFKTFIDREGKLGTIYDAIYHKGHLYLGSNQGLYVRPPNQKTFEFIGGTKGQVWALKEIDGTLFCGHNLGTFIIDGKIATQIAFEEGTWDVQPLEGTTDLILQGNYSGLFVLQRENNTWSLRNKLEGFDISSKDLVIDGQQIYVGHEYKGLYELDVSDDFRTVGNYKLIDAVGTGINSDVIQLGGDVLYSTPRGIYVKTETSDSFKKNEVLSSFIESNGYTSGKMIKINEGSFWMFSDQSLIQINKEPINDTFEAKNILIPHFKRSETKGYESLIQLPNQNYLIATSQGYLLWDNRETEEVNGKIVIDRVRISNRNGSNELLDLDQDNSMDHRTNVVEFFFHVTDYNVFDSVKYQYFLDGDSDSWSDVFEKGSILFENLNHGDYQLRIRSIVNGSISEDEAVFAFTIEPPFYLSRTAIVIYVILSLGILFLVGRIFKWYYNRKRNLDLEKQRQQMELDLLKSQKDIADLKNQQLNSDIESRNRDLAIKTMAMIRKNETLNQLRGELDNLPTTQESKSLKKMLDKSLNSKQDWVAFEEAFNNADKDFFKKIKEKHPNLTSGDLRLCVYLRLNLSSKEIAPLLNISPRSVEIKRYRLRKKMGLSRDDSLTGYIVEI
ncbi:hypothetical protein AAU57_06270 [Nonlabens sp. YIK11]|uniref:helix-turn-helix and ligand-binding sensor domain-containing protein n=1 Tax=Nonlabens sp. YIK11 TaxID=1453349 RepID=UPI0006DCE03A|nr:triple tyrosine motif-containing protein [Nonlabens sp. YIK11]KQC32972.1 hypothetical protein AAU57_06270 [Nonlabens sp. YIK11]